MKVHPVAALFPMLPDDELAELAKDIHDNGLSEPIVMQGEVLIDGRNRLKACEMAGVTPVFKELGGKKDPIPFIISRNIHRRHLDASQRAMIAAEMANLPHGRSEKKKAATLPLTPPVTQKDAAKLMGVGERTVRDAKAVAEADPELADQVVNGELTVAEAKREVRKRAAPKPEKKPHRLQPILDRAKEFKSIVSAIGTIRNRVEKLTEEDCGKLIHWSNIQRDVMNLQSAVKFAAPFGVCPYCLGKKGGCSACKELGWVNQSIFEKAPKEKQDAVARLSE